jgi:hypothetical protein
LAGRYSGCERLSAAFCVLKPRSITGAVFSNPVRDTPAEIPAVGRMPALAWSARARLASYCSLADW